MAALVENLEELHLAVMRDASRKLRGEREKVVLNYKEYVLELAERECEEQRRSRIRKLLKESGLPLDKSLANFDAKRLSVPV